MNIVNMKTSEKIFHKINLANKKIKSLRLESKSFTLRKLLSIDSIISVNLN